MKKQVTPEEMKRELDKAMFGTDCLSSSRNVFEALKKVKVAFKNLLALHRTMIKADYEEKYIENIDEGFYGVSRFLTICGLLGFKPNVVGETVKVAKGDSLLDFYVYGCPDFQRNDKSHNLYIRNRRQEVDVVGEMKSFIGILVNEIGIKVDSYFPMIEEVTAENKVKVFPFKHPITMINVCPVTGIEFVSMYGVSDKCLIRGGDHGIKAAMSNDGIKLTAEEKNLALDVHAETIICDFIRTVYSKPEMLKIDPFDVFANNPQSIIFSMQDDVSNKVIVQENTTDV